MVLSQASCSGVSSGAGGGSGVSGGGNSGGTSAGGVLISSRARGFLNRQQRKAQICVARERPAVADLVWSACGNYMYLTFARQNADCCACPFPTGVAAALYCA